MSKGIIENGEGDKVNRGREVVREWIHSTQTGRYKKKEKMHFQRTTKFRENILKIVRYI